MQVPPTQSGGDHEFFARILLAGFYIVYEPEGLSWHRHRRTWEETHKAIQGYGTGLCILDKDIICRTGIQRVEISFELVYTSTVPKSCQGNHTPP